MSAARATSARGTSRGRARTRARARSGPNVVMIDTASSPTGIWNSMNAAWYDVTPPEPGLASTVMA